VIIIGRRLGVSMGIGAWLFLAILLSPLLLAVAAVYVLVATINWMIEGGWVAVGTVVLLVACIVAIAWLGAL
jgi:hypothetical protein